MTHHRAPSADTLTRRRLLAVAASSALLAACGGGDGSSRGPLPSPGSLPPVGVPPRRAYVGRVNAIEAYAIDPTSGALDTLLSTTALAAAGDTASLALDPTQRWLFATSATQVLRVFAVDANGALTLVPNTASANGAVFVAVHPNGRFVYVALRNAGQVAAFSFDPVTGALTDIGTPVASGGTSPVAIAFNPTGRFAFVSHNVSSDLGVLRIDTTTGALTATAGSPYGTGLSPLGVTVEPNGRTVYVANANAGSVSAFALDAVGGALVELAGSPFALTNALNVASLAAHPNGKFLYAADQTGNVLALAIDTAGRLSALPGGALAVGGFPSAIALSESGDFAYVTQKNANTVSAFSIDPVSGALRALNGPARGTGVGPVAIALVN